MPWKTIRKGGPFPVPPNLEDYAATQASFTWEAARAELDGLPGAKGLNIAYEAVAPPTGKWTSILPETGSKA